MKKTLLFSALLSLAVSLSACTPTTGVLPSLRENPRGAYANSQMDEIPFRDDLQDFDEDDTIVNLPDNLYMKAISSYALGKSYGFTVEEPMDFTITTEVNQGNLTIAVTGDSTEVLPFVDCPSGTNTYTFSITEPGNYRLQIKQSKHYGSLKVKGTPSSSKLSGELASLDSSY